MACLTLTTRGHFHGSTWITYQKKTAPEVETQWPITCLLLYVAARSRDDTSFRLGHCDSTSGAFVLRRGRSGCSETVCWIFWGIPKRKRRHVGLRRRQRMCSGRRGHLGRVVFWAFFGFGIHRKSARSRQLTLDMNEVIKQYTPYYADF